MRRPIRNGRRDSRCISSEGILDLRQTLLDIAPVEFINHPAILDDLIGAGELAVLVIPIDKEAPKARLILPQVQAIRDLLDSDAYCMVVKERELRHALERLKRPPKLVVTDSQAFLKLAGDTPDDVLMSSFSILFARFKGGRGESPIIGGLLAIDPLGLLITTAASSVTGIVVGHILVFRWAWLLFLIPWSWFRLHSGPHVAYMVICGSAI